MLQAVVIAGLLAVLAGGVLAQGLGIGIGLDDARMNSALSGPPPTGCLSNFVFDWSAPDGTACDSITAVIR